MATQPEPASSRSRASVAEFVDTLCDDFERALRDDREPRIEDYLGRVGPATRPWLLQELLTLELEYRRRHGDRPESLEYERRFADAETIVRRAFDERAAETDVLPAETATTPDVTAGVRYVNLRFHRAGGLGEVFRAKDDALRRDVALKFIRPGHRNDPFCSKQFLVEAEVTGRLDHPGVVPVYGYGTTTDGRPFYAMRFIEGIQLKDEIEKYHREGASRLDLHRLVGHLVSVCQTVAYAHNRGIVHRDIKPENIMIGRFGETLVLDWGLAVPVRRDARARESGEVSMRPVAAADLDASSLTGAGTIGYMSPEQLPDLPGAVGPASDVYSLGATLYKLLTGNASVRGSNVPATWDKIRRGDFPRPHEVQPEVPPVLEAVCLKAMASEGAARYPGALELARDLQAWMADEPVSVYSEPVVERAARWLRRHRSWAFAGVACAAFVVFAAVWAAGRAGNSAALERAARVDAEAARLDGMLVAARFGAEAVASDVERRWEELQERAAEPELAPLVVGAIDKPGDSPEQIKLQEWLQRQREHSSNRSKSWALFSAVGKMLARAPRDEKVLDKNFASRDYFHGLGRELSDAESQGVKPITEPHLSVAYVSKADFTTTVAFSVPIWNGADRGTPLGVLTMSVDVGEYSGLLTRSNARQFAALVDLRDDWIAGKPQAGLILQHPGLRRARLAGGHLAFRLDEARLTDLRALDEKAKLRQTLLNGAGEAERAMLEEEELPGSTVLDYHDPLARQTSRPVAAAFAPVLSKRVAPSNLEEAAAARGISWVVIVHERLEDARPDE